MYWNHCPIKYGNKYKCLRHYIANLIYTIPLLKIGPFAMKLSPKEESSWVNVREWVKSQLELFTTPRHLEIIRLAKQYGISRAKAISLLKRDFPSYQSTGRPQFPWPVKTYRNQVFSFYGTVAADLAFFSKQSFELRGLGITRMEDNPALVMIDVATRFCIVEVLRKGKSAKSIVNGCRRAFEKYYSQMGIYPKLVLSDQEAGIKSKLIREYFLETKTKLKTFSYSRKKSYMAENMIRILRGSLAILKKYHSNRKMTWISLIDSVVEDHNATKIVMHKTPLSYAPRDITPKTFPKYQQEIYEKIPGSGMIPFAIAPQLFRWKLPLQTRVNLIKKAISVPGIGTKASEQPLDDAIWIIKKRLVHVNVQQKIVKTLLLEKENDSEIKTQQPENAVVPLMI